MSRIYLSSPMFGCPESEWTGWRHEAKQLLGVHNCVDPADRVYEKGEAHLSIPECYELVGADLADLDRCDAVIANCWKPSAGTSMEIFYAKQNRKIVVVVAQWPVSAWLRYCADVVTPSLSQACHWIASELALEDCPCLTQ